VSNLREKIWGHGFQSVYYRLRPGGFSRFSHNSYIEYLYDYGIIGLSLLVLFVLFLIIIEIKFIREKNKYAPVMGMLLIITIFLSAFSYFFEESNIIQPIAVAYGIILGQAYKERKRYEN
jgi:O-antigen ligase